MSLYDKQRIEAHFATKYGRTWHIVGEAGRALCGQRLDGGFIFKHKELPRHAICGRCETKRQNNERVVGFCMECGAQVDQLALDVECCPACGSDAVEKKKS